MSSVAPATLKIAQAIPKRTHAYFRESTAKFVHIQKEFIGKRNPKFIIF